MPRPWTLLGPLAVAAVALQVAAQDAQPVPDRPVPRTTSRPPMTAPAGYSPTTDPGLTDEEALRQAGLPPDDGAKLVEYLKLRTVSDADRGKILGLIARFKADGFDDRLAAAAEVERFGPAAIGPLKAAEGDPDPEVAYRVAQVLGRLGKVPHAAVAAAAVRGVVRLKPAGAAAALLGFLPLADSELLADEIRTALVPLAAAGGEPDPAVVAALADPSPVRRGAAYAALAGGGRDKVPAAFDRLAEAVRKEADPDARFRGLWALAWTAKGREVVADLIALTPSLPRGRLWQVEDLLLLLAGEHPPGGRFGRGADALAKARDAWAGWWAKAGADPAKLADGPRVLGVLDLVELETQGFGSGRVSSLGPDGRPRWQFPARLPHEARVTPAGRVLTVEGSGSVVAERDPAGKGEVRTQPVNQAVGVRPLAGGGKLVFGKSHVTEYDPAGKAVWTFPRAYGDIAAGCRLPNGDTLFVTYTPGPNCYRLDPKGKEVGKPLAVGRLQGPAVMVGIDPVGDNRLLVGEPAQVAEYDLTTGKLEWKYAVQTPTSVQRLGNGNTLIASYNANRVVEVDPAGEVVWEYAPKDKLRVARAYRR